MSGFVTSPMITMNSSNSIAATSFTRISSSTDPVTTVTVTVVTGVIEIGSSLFYVVTVAGSSILILLIIIIILCVAACFLRANKGRSYTLPTVTVVTAGQQSNNNIQISEGSLNLPEIQGTYL